MGEEDQTISKETIDKLHLTEDDLKARRRVLTQGNEDKSEHLIAFDDVGLGKPYLKRFNTCFFTGYFS